MTTRPRLTANAYGQRKAARFRARFGLAPIDLASVDPSLAGYGDVHDYLHTVLGALPCFPEENDVLALEERIVTGQTPVPRGLEVIR